MIGVQVAMKNIKDYFNGDYSDKRLSMFFKDELSLSQISKIEGVKEEAIKEWIVKRLKEYSSYSYKGAYVTYSFGEVIKAFKMLKQMKDEKK